MDAKQIQFAKQKQSGELSTIIHCHVCWVKVHPTNIIPPQCCTNISSIVCQASAPAMRGYQKAHPSRGVYTRTEWARMGLWNISGAKNAVGLALQIIEYQSLLMNSMMSACLNGLCHRSQCFSGDGPLWISNDLLWFELLLYRQSILFSGKQEFTQCSSRLEEETCQHRNTQTSARQMQQINTIISGTVPTFGHGNPA